MFDLGSILVSLGLLMLVGLYVARPLLERSSTAVTQEEHSVSALMAERDRLLDALQELDFDQALGKIPAQDYPIQRASLLQRGADVLRALDQRQAEADSNQPAVDDAVDRLEAAIAARRALQDQPAPESTEKVRDRAPIQPDDDLEAQIAARRRSRSGKAAGFCPQCGGPIQKSDQFCARCGANLI